MSRVDLATSDADFIEFEFPDEATAERADRACAFAAHTTGTTRQSRPGHVEAIRAGLEAAGIPWTESESSITEEDMWPDEGNDEDEPAGPRP